MNNIVPTNPIEENFYMLLIQISRSWNDLSNIYGNLEAKSMHRLEKNYRMIGLQAESTKAIVDIGVWYDIHTVNIDVWEINTGEFLFTFHDVYQSYEDMMLTVNKAITIFLDFHKISEN